MEEFQYEKICRFVDILTTEALNKDCSISEQIDRIEFVAAAYRNGFHTGTYQSTAFESRLKEIGEALLKNTQTVDLDINNQGNGLKILHLVSSLHITGGHTRLFENYAQIDSTNRHFLYITRQLATDVPKRITGLEGNIIERIFAPAHINSIDRIQHLFSIVGNFDVVVLHHHPEDAIPVVALSQLQNPPVLCMNHADHVFWLGASITDCCLNIRPVGQDISLQKRQIKNNILTPVIITVSKPDITRSQAKQALGIAQEQKVFLTIAQYYKFIPDGAHDFFSTARQIVELDKNIHLYVIGVDNEHNLVNLNFHAHPQIHLLGFIENCVPYQIAADYYIESMPYSSLTSILESVKLGAYPFLMYAPSSRIVNLSSQPEFDGIVANAKSQKEFLDEIKSVITNNPAQNKKTVNALLNRINYYNGPDYWIPTLADVYSKLLSGEMKRTAQQNNPQIFDKEEIPLSRLMYEQIKKDKFNGFDFIRPFRIYKPINTIRIIPLLWTFTFRPGRLGFLLRFIKEQLKLYLLSIKAYIKNASQKTVNLPA